MVLMAGLAIVFAAVNRLIHPTELTDTSAGIVLSLIATGINGVVGATLVAKGKRLQSSALEADGHHLLSDVWTSIGVVAGLLLTKLTGHSWLDSLSAVLVALLIFRTAIKIMKQSMGGLVDEQLGPAGVALLGVCLAPFRSRGFEFSGIRTRTAGRHVFIRLTMHVPPEMSVRVAHEVADEVELSVGAALELSTVDIHVEPLIQTNA